MAAPSLNSQDGVSPARRWIREVTPGVEALELLDKGSDPVADDEPDVGDVF